jgi:isopentenyl-diphosphate delta-isomerase
VLEEVVLVDDTGTVLGSAPKATVHHGDTPLHLGFSCYLTSPSGQLLLTQRSWDKLTWPGWWTNTCCGHPLPGEGLVDAVARRLDFELGTRAAELTLVLPAFRYRAECNGVVENELCPVFLGRVDAAVSRRPSEVAAVEWVDLSSLAVGRESRELALTPWARLQLPLLAEVLNLERK